MTCAVKNTPCCWWFDIMIFFRRQHTCTHTHNTKTKPNQKRTKPTNKTTNQPRHTTQKGGGMENMENDGSIQIWRVIDLTELVF